MAVTGDLEQLPIVDVIQLMHTTRNSGILYIRGRKGECRLVFKGGYIVSASHLNNRGRIGEIMIARGLISEQVLVAALAEQQQAGPERQPLVAMLVGKGVVAEKAAYAALRSLIETTIVEVLTWRRGSFLLEASREAAEAGKYYPQAIAQEVNVEVQGALMDALRLFDEKIRDGELTLEAEGEEAEGEETASGIDADVLGLSDLDRLEGLPSRSAPALAETVADALPGRARPAVRRLNELITALPGLQGAPEVATAVLQFVGEFFERSLTLVVRPGALVAEKGIGIWAGREQGVVPPLGFRIPLDTPSMLQQAVASGRLYFGPCADGVLSGQLYARIGPPAEAMALLLPVRQAGKSVFLTYADFGRQKAGSIPLELVEMLADQAEQALTGRL